MVLFIVNSNVRVHTVARMSIQLYAHTWLILLYVHISVALQARGAKRVPES